MRSRDPRDPIYHDVDGEKAEASFVRRHQKWVAKQEPYYQQYFCAHGYYTGYNGTFAHTCPRCSK